MIEQMLEQARHQWLNIGSVVFLLVLIPIRNWTRSIALGKIKKQFDRDEHIVYEPSFPFIIEFFAPMLFGGGSLELILSSNNFQIMNGIMASLSLIVLFFVFLSSCSKYVITNKKFYYVPSFNFMYKFNKLFRYLECNFCELNISDISCINDKICYGRRVLVVKTKTGTKFPRLCFDDIEQTKSIISSQIELI